MGGRADGFNERAADAARFELLKSRHGRSRRAGHHFAENSRMLGSCGNHLGRTDDCLHGKFERQVSGKPAGDAPVRKRLDHQINIGGTASAQASDRIQQFFLNGPNLANA